MRRLPKKEYFTIRLNESIKMGNTRKANYFRSRLHQLGQSETKAIKAESAKESALRKCRKVFEGLNESERLHKANAIIKNACANGFSVNQAIAFLKEAKVMSDTELMHSVTF